MKLWTCSATFGGHTILTQVRAPTPEGALDAFVSERYIERVLGNEESSWSLGAPHRRVFGPEMNDEFVSTWDVTISNADGDGVHIQFIETVDQEWELFEDEI